MTTAGRRLVLHMGIGKTGSSALQVGFVRNRKLLAEAGVLYPSHRSDDLARAGGVVSGNGMRLRAWLAPRPHDTAQGARLMARLRRELSGDGVDTVLYSSEFLYLFRRDRLEELRRQMEAIGVTVTCVVYVRDVAGHALSSYSQVVKRARFTGDFIDYLDPATPGSYHLGLSRLSPLPDIIGPENVTVIHYDGVREDLMGHFVREVLGLRHLPGLSLPPRTINRSLTVEELQLMRALNAHLETSAEAKRVSDALIQQPLGSASPSIRRHDLAVLHSLFGSHVDRVNELFFAEPTLSVSTPDLQIREDTAQPAPLTPREEFLLSWLATLARVDSPASGASDVGDVSP